MAESGAARWRWLRWPVGALVALVVLVAGAFVLLQTPPGLAWLGRVAARSASGPGMTVQINGLSGIAPFHLRARRITVSDRTGAWLALDDLRFELSAGALLGGRVDIGRLTAAAVTVDRLPQRAAAPTPQRPLADLLKVPQLPLPVRVERLAIDRLVLDAPVLGDRVVATVAGHARLDAGTLDASLDLHRTDGTPGSVALALAAAGTPPVLNLHLAVDEPTGIVLARLLGRTDRAPLSIKLQGEGPLADWHGTLAMSAGKLARIDGKIGIAASRSTVMTVAARIVAAPLLPAKLAPLVGTDVPVSLRATIRPDGTASLDSLSVALAAGKLSGNAALGPANHIAARLHADLPHLATLATALDAKLGGAMKLDVTIATPAAGRLTAAVDGTVTGFTAAAPALDALAGGRVTLAARAERGADGVIAIDRLSLAGAAAKLSATGHFDPAASRLAADLDAAVPDLRPLGAALKTPLAGGITATAHVGGPLDHLAATANIAAKNLAVGAARLDQLTVAATIPDLAQPRTTLDGRFRTGDLAGTLALAADATDPRWLTLSGLKLAAAGGAVTGSLRVDRTSFVVDGTLDGAIPELARWSRLAGMPLAGSLSLKAKLAATRGQSLDFKIAGDRLAFGAGKARTVLRHLAANASLADLRGTPTGKADATLSGLSRAGATVNRASLTLASSSSGRFRFTADAAGTATRPFTLALGGDADLAPASNKFDLRVAKLAGTFGRERFRLARTLQLRRRPGDLAFSNLDLRLGSGQLDGSGSLRGTALALKLAARNLSLADGARLAGLPPASGTLAGNVVLSGTLAAPRGHFTLTGRRLDLTLSPQQKIAGVSVDLGGDWNGRKLSLKGKATGRKGVSLQVTGALPLVLTAAPAGLALPPNGALSLRLRGSGELANLADLLPLGEDTLSGHFALDAGVAGTLAAPAASGRLTISGGRYHSFAAGAVLTGINAEVTGDRDRVTLRRLTAKDGASGTLSASGSVNLAGPGGPTAALTAKLHDLRVAALDQAVVTASGTVAVAGPIAAPRVTANVTTDRAEIRIPDSLPPDVVKLQVHEVGGGAARRRARAAAPPALPVPLDVTLTMPGRVFVRGHGLDSEWRGRLHITGTSAAPQIVGALHAVRGTFELLGKTFTLSEGTITFDGGATIDPRLKITTTVSAANITAQAVIGGRASAPTITLTSIPILPQDQILSRVLFDRPLGQISIGEGLQVAQAAATLAGGGPGIVGRLRSGLGLDRLSLGSAPGSGAASTTVTGGKYIGHGIYVGATQGLSTKSSKVTVQIELRPHVTVETDVGAAGDRGITLNYKYDY